MIAQKKEGEEVKASLLFFFFPHALILMKQSTLDNQDVTVITSPSVTITFVVSTITTLVSSPKLSEPHVISRGLFADVSGLRRKRYWDHDSNLMAYHHKVTIAFEEFLKTWSS